MKPSECACSPSGHISGWLPMFPGFHAASPNSWGHVMCLVCGTVINNNVMRGHTDGPEIMLNPGPRRAVYVRVKP